MSVTTARRMAATGPANDCGAASQDIGADNPGAAAAARRLLECHHDQAPRVIAAAQCRAFHGGDMAAVRWWRTVARLVDATIVARPPFRPDLIQLN